MTAFPIRANRVVVPTSAPAAPKASDPTWVNIDPETMPEDIRGHYYAYRQALHTAEQLRKVFEEEANEAFDVGKTNCLKFGYKFGRLSAAIVPRRNAAGSAALSLSDLAKPR